MKLEGDFQIMKLIAKKLIKEGKVEEAIKLYEELVNLSRKEEGCISYDLYQDESDSRILAVIEEWENQDVLDKHSNSEHFTRLVPMIGQLTEEKFGIDKYNKII